MGDINSQIVDINLLTQDIDQTLDISNQLLVTNLILDINNPTLDTKHLLLDIKTQAPDIKDLLMDTSHQTTYTNLQTTQQTPTTNHTETTNLVSLKPQLIGPLQLLSFLVFGHNPTSIQCNLSTLVTKLQQQDTNLEFW